MNSNFFKALDDNTTLKGKKKKIKYWVSGFRSVEWSFLTNLDSDLVSWVIKHLQNIWRRAEKVKQLLVINFQQRHLH